MVDVALEKLAVGEENRALGGVVVEDQRQVGAWVPAEQVSRQPFLLIPASQVTVSRAHLDVAAAIH